MAIICPQPLSNERAGRRPAGGEEPTPSSLSPSSSQSSSSSSSSDARPGVMSYFVSDLQAIGPLLFPQRRNKFLKTLSGVVKTPHVVKEIYYNPKMGQFDLNIRSASTNSPRLLSQFKLVPLVPGVVRTPLAFILLTLTPQSCAILSSVIYFDFRELYNPELEQFVINNYNHPTPRIGVKYRG